MSERQNGAHFGPATAVTALNDATASEVVSNPVASVSSTQARRIVKPERKEKASCGNPSSLS